MKQTRVREIGARIKQQRERNAPALGWLLAPVALLLIVTFSIAWSWFVTPIYLPVGSHLFGFGRSFTSRRPPPRWDG